MRQLAVAFGAMAALAGGPTGCRGSGTSNSGSDAGDDASATPPSGGTGTAPGPTDGSAGGDEGGGQGSADPPANTSPTNSNGATNPNTPASSGSSGSPSTPAGPTEETHFIGRFADEVGAAGAGGKVFGWPGSALQTQFTGTGISILLERRPTMAGDAFDVFVDDQAPTLLVPMGAPGTAMAYPLAAGLADGTHTVRVQKRTEMRVGTARFAGWQVTGGQTVPTSRSVARRLLIIGDSMSTGYGVLGASASCHYSPSTQNAALSWGIVAGQTLGADVHDIAWSGKGVARNYGDPGSAHVNNGSSGDTMAALWKQAVAPDGGTFVPWDLTSWVPNAVVINLGTNDFSANTDATPYYVDAMVGLVTDVIAAYPQAAVALAIGTMLFDNKSGAPSRSQALAALNTVVARVTAGNAAARVQVLDLGSLANEDMGCDSHPNTHGQALMAEALKGYLAAAVGWR